MNNPRSGFVTAASRLLTLVVFLFCGALAGDDECAAAGGYGFVCGPVNGEDLVLVPGTDWIIASALAADGSLKLVHARQKSWEVAYPGNRPRAVQDMDTYGACPGSPDPNAFVTHGLNLRAGDDGRSTLYVVGHGGREAIEVFEVDARGAKPALTWVGCVMTPDGLAINSVASLGDGSLVATIPLEAGFTINDALGGKVSGGVYQWSPGDTGFVKLQGTDLPYANGIEVSADGKEIFVATSGGFEVIAYSRTNPAQRLRSTGPLTFLPDNLHMGADGRLVTAGLLSEDEACGSLHAGQDFDLAVFAACPRPFTVVAVDPRTMEVATLASSGAIPQFSNITMGLQVGDELWIGTFSGDRIAYLPLKP